MGKTTALRDLAIPIEKVTVHLQASSAADAAKGREYFRTSSGAD